MKIAPIAEIKRKFSEFVRASEEGPIVVTRNGHAVAVMIGLADEDEIERLTLAYSPKFRDLIEKSRTQIRETGGIRHEDFWQEVERGDRRGPRTMKSTSR